MAAAFGAAPAAGFAAAFGAAFAAGFGGAAAAGFASAFGANEQAVFGANRTVVVCAQLKPFTPGIFAALVVFNPADMAQAQLAVGVVAFELGLYLGFGVIQDEVVASACG